MSDAAEMLAEIARTTYFDTAFGKSRHPMTPFDKLDIVTKTAWLSVVQNVLEAALGRRRETVQ